MSEPNTKELWKRILYIFVGGLVFVGAVFAFCFYKDMDADAILVYAISATGVYAVCIYVWYYPPDDPLPSAELEEQETADL